MTLPPALNELRIGDSESIPSSESGKFGCRGCADSACSASVRLSMIFCIPRDPWETDGSAMAKIGAS